MSRNPLNSIFFWVSQILLFLAVSVDSCPELQASYRPEIHKQGEGLGNGSQVEILIE